MNKLKYLFPFYVFLANWLYFVLIGGRTAYTMDPTLFFCLETLAPVLLPLPGVLLLYDEDFAALCRGRCALRSRGTLILAAVCLALALVPCLQLSLLRMIHLPVLDRYARLWSVLLSCGAGVLFFRSWKDRPSD